MSECAAGCLKSAHFINRIKNTGEQKNTKRQKYPGDAAVLLDPENCNHEKTSRKQPLFKCCSAAET